MVAPHGVEGIYQSLASIGHALNREDSARELIGRLRAREAAVRRRVSGKPVVSVLMPVGFDPVITIGKHAFITELIEIAGGHSVTSDLPQEWQQISLEAVMARAPEALLLVRRSEDVDGADSEPARMVQLAGGQEQTDLLRGRPDRTSQPGCLRCTGGTRQKNFIREMDAPSRTVNQ